jgi:hypothetical protein
MEEERMNKFVLPSVAALLILVMAVDAGVPALAVFFSS